MFNKVKKENFTFLKLSIVLFNILVFLILIESFFANKENFVLYSINNIGLIYFINTTLAILGLGTVFLYNHFSNNRDLFLLVIYFLNILTELVAKNIYYIQNGEIFIDVFLFSLIFKTSILLIFLFGLRSNYKSVIEFTKERTCILISISTLCVVLDASSILNYRNLEPNNLIFSIILVSIIVLFFLIFSNLKASILRNDNLMLMICTSLIFLGVRTMYQLSGVLIMRNKLRENCIIDSQMTLFLALVCLLSGVLVEIVNIFNKHKIAEEKYNLFYQIVDNDKYTMSLIYDEELIYANKMMKKNWMEDENYNGDLKRLDNLIDKQTENPVVRQFLRNIHKKKSSSTIIEDKKGSIYSVDYNCINISKDNEKSLDVINVRDITKNFKGEQDLELNIKKYKAISSNIEELIFIVDEYLKINYINRHCEKIIGKDLESIIGSSFLEYIENEYLNLSYEFNEKIKVSSGEFKEFTIKLDELRDANENIIGYVLVCSDNQNKIRLKELDTKIKLAEKSVIRNENFANLSHDLRTPIHIIYSSLQLLDTQKNILSSEDFKESFNRYERVMKINTMRLLKLINDIIDINKIDSGSLKIKYSCVNIVELVESIAASVIPYIKSKNINFIFDTELEERYIECDQGMIERVFLNLISNAVKFTQEYGEISMFIEFDDEWIKIRVKDNGIGISKEYKDKIFERFVQCDNGALTKKGSGIGLSLVKTLVEMHCGELEIISEEGNGSEFIVYLPNSTDEFNEKVIQCMESTEMSLLGDISIEFSDIET